MKIPKPKATPRINPFSLELFMYSCLNTANLASGTITINMEYVRARTRTTIKGTLVTNDFFQGLPIVNDINVKMYIKLVKRNRIFVSGVTLIKSSYYSYLNLLTENPPVKLYLISSLNPPIIAKIIMISPSTCRANTIIT